MKIFLNDKQLEVQNNTTLEQVMLDIYDNEDGFAAAVNNTVIPRKNWNTTTLNDADKIVLIKLACGG